MSTLRANAIQTVAGKPIVNSTGSILQVVQTVYKTTFSMTSGVGGWTAVSGYTASITPSSTSNRILVKMDIMAGLTYYQWKARITRNGNVISDALGDLAGSRPQATISSILAYNSSSSQYDVRPTSMTYLDSPATTSAVTYGLEIGGYSDSYPVYVNRSNQWQNTTLYDATPISTITLLEVSA